MEKDRIHEGFRRILMFVPVLVLLVLLPDWYVKIRGTAISEGHESFSDLVFALFYKTVGVISTLSGISWIINGFMGTALSEHPLNDREISLDRTKSIKFGITALGILMAILFLYFLFSP